MSAWFTVYFYDPLNGSPSDTICATQEHVNADGYAEAAETAVGCISDDYRIPQDWCWVVREAEGQTVADARKFRVQAVMTYEAEEYT